MEAHFQKSLPENVSLQLQLPWLNFDVEGEPADWTPVREACKSWYELHRRVRESPPLFGSNKTLFYLDGGDFLELIDVRDGIRNYIFGPLRRDIYLYCTEIRSRQEIVTRFQKRVTEEDLVEKVLEPLVAERLMFTEGRQYLSMAIACTPGEAIRRMRQEDDGRKDAQREH